jgi:hypothetical protein
MYEILYASKKTVRDTQIISIKKDTAKTYVFLHTWVFIRRIRKEAIKTKVNPETIHLESELLIIAARDVANSDKKTTILNFNPVLLSIWNILNCIGLIKFHHVLCLIKPN